jgi:predicted signal transduction protein with EAL and GGDEF domain
MVQARPISTNSPCHCGLCGAIGTRHSSLSSVRPFPIDALEIDR